MNGGRAVITGVVSAITLLSAWPVCAQGSQAAPAPASVRRPFRGLFGAPGGADSPHSLVASASLFAAYDDNVLEALSDRRVRSSYLQESGTYQGAHAGLHYTFDVSGTRASFRGRLGGQLRYVRKRDVTSSVPTSQGDVMVELRLTRSLTFRARQSVSYRSNYNFALTPGIDEAEGHDIGDLEDPDLDLFGMRALRAATTVSLSQRFGRNTSLAAGYNFRSVEILESDQPDSRFRDYQTQTGSLRFTHSRPLTRHAELQLGYGVTVSDRRSRTGEPRYMQNVIAGVNYGRALSFSRRTTLSFGSGSAITTTDRLDTEGGVEPRTRARLIGHVTLAHELGRTWTVQASYTRGLRARDGFGELYLTDGVRAGVGGLITRRLSFMAATQWSSSSLDREGRNGHHGQSAVAQATYALTSYAAMFARYVYYSYRYDEDIPLDARFPRQLDRQGVRIGLMASVPLIR